MNLSIRLVEEYDASFIVDLRNNSKLNRYLNSTSANIEDQIQWIRKYKINEQLKKEFYFVIQENGIKRGLYRIYKINNVSFTVGSWLFDSCENNELPILTDLVIGDFGFYELNKSIMLFDVRKKNIKVIRYHTLKNPLLYSEDELDNWYLINIENWEKSKKNVLDFFNISQNDYLLFRNKSNKDILNNLTI